MSGTSASASGNGMNQQSRTNGQYNVNTVANSLSELGHYAGLYEPSGYPNNGGSEVYPTQGYNGSYHSNTKNDHISGGGGGGNGSSFYIRAPPRIENRFHQVDNGMSGDSSSRTDRYVAHPTPQGPQVRNVPGNSYLAPPRVLSRSSGPQGNDHYYTVDSTGNSATPENAFSNYYDYNDFPQLPGPSNSAGGGMGQTGSLWTQHAGGSQKNNEISLKSSDFPALPTQPAPSFVAEELNRNKQPIDNNLSTIPTPGLTLGRLSGSSYFAEPYLPLKQRQQAMNVFDSQPAFFDGGSSDFFRSNNPANYHSPIVVYRPKVKQDPIGTPINRSRTSNSNTVPGLGKKVQHQGASSSRTPPPLGSSPKADDDEWGILGLLPIIENKNNPNNIHQGVGIDLTTLGLDLTSTSELFRTFASPWAEEPLKEEPNFTIPACYNENKPPPFNYALISKMSVGSLFYTFYSMPKDVAQLYAAHTLATRGWMYHKTLHLWLTKDPNLTYYRQANNCERGSYICFNPNSFAPARKDDFVLDYDLIEPVPALPQIN